VNGTSGDDRPIGVFDSGIGGLTVLREIVRQLPNESIIYFGDTARVPYGSKSGDTVRRYSNEAATLLIERDIKLLVIACNTATAHAGAELAVRLTVPVVGVIEPGARAAVRATKNGRVGVIATAGTVRSGAYDLSVRRKLPGVRVYAQPCPLFVPLVEEGWTEHDAARIIAREYLGPLIQMDIDALILGCTHYPLLKPLIEETVGPAVAIVDSGEETAIEVAEALHRRGALRAASSPPDLVFLASDAPHRFREVGRRLIGSIIGDVHHVDVDDPGRAA
jgi:glutamate racemase